MLLDDLIIPEPVLPQNPAGYELPTTPSALLGWDFVAKRMSEAPYYWIATADANGRPHTIPLWGIWYKNRVHFDGHPKTRWARNLIQNPKVAVHVPNAQEVVIIEGRAQIIEDDDIDETTWQILDRTYQTKYKTTEGSPYWVVMPQKVIAWDAHRLDHMTRWLFE